MPGPAPNPNKQRRNKKTTAGVLVADPDRDVPALPAFPPTPEKKHHETGELLPPEPWHPLARSFWNDVWTGPTGSQYGQAEEHGLLIIATLVHKLYTCDDLETFQKLAAEIRLQRRDFGLTPMSRANLHWEIANAENAIENRAEKIRKRREAQARREESSPKADVEGTVVEDNRSILEA